MENNVEIGIFDIEKMKIKKIFENKFIIKPLLFGSYL